MSEVEPLVLLFAGKFQFRGSCTYTLRLAELLPARGFQARVICPDASLIDKHRRDELNIEAYPYLQSTVWNRVVLRSLARELEKEPPDIIHVQSRHLLASGKWLARELDRPMVVTVHDHLFPAEVLQLDYDICQRIIAVSESVKKNLVDRAGIPPELITVIPSGVYCSLVTPETPCNEKRFASLPDAKQPVLSSGTVPVIGTAGPLETVKGFPFFLGAAAKVLAAGQRDVEFLVAGAGPEEGNLRRLARQLGINDHVTFAPNLVDFADAIAAIDVFCLPSLQQGIGTIMLEAMAMGRPVIATSVGGVNQVIRDKETGFLVPPSDSDALARQILWLLENPDEARRIAQAAREEVLAEFSAERMLNDTLTVYRELIASAVSAE